jgi:hypothetical protein
MTPRWLDSVGRDFARSPILMLALSLVLLQVLASLCANLIAPFDPVAQAVEARMAAPGGEFLLGTDKLGRDVLSRILHGYRSSLGIAFSAVAVALLLGGSLGIWAAYKGGWIDRLVMRLADVLFAFPIILLAIGVIAVLGSNTLSIVVAIAVVYSPIFARLLRAHAGVAQRRLCACGAQFRRQRPANHRSAHHAQPDECDSGADQPVPVDGYPVGGQPVVSGYWCAAASPLAGAYALRGARLHVYGSVGEPVLWLGDFACVAGL